MSLPALVLIGLPVLYCWPRVLRFTYRLIRGGEGGREAIQRLVGPQQEVRYPRFYRYGVIATRTLAVIGIGLTLYFYLAS